MALSREEIWAAADKLSADGQRPTLEGVRQITGGSYTTISPLLKEWKAKQATATPMREPPPQSVADVLSELGAECWSRALELANARMATEREILEKTRAELEDNATEAIALADERANEASGLRATVDQIRTELTATKSAADAAAREIDELKRTAARNRDELAIAQRERDQARETAATAREEAARLTGKVEAINQKYDALVTRIAPAQFL